MRDSRALVIYLFISWLGIVRSGNSPGAIVRVGNCPGGNCLRGNCQGWEFSGVGILRGANYCLIEYSVEKSVALGAQGAETK